MLISLAESFLNILFRLPLTCSISSFLCEFTSSMSTWRLHQREMLASGNIFERLLRACHVPSGVESCSKLVSYRCATVEYLYCLVSPFYKYRGNRKKWEST